VAAVLTPPAIGGNYVVDVTIRKTEDEKYPSGWDYSLHLGEVGSKTVLRYDNAHERSKGHERHTGEEEKPITGETEQLRNLWF